MNVPILVTIVPNMRTKVSSDNLSLTLFGKTRRAVLSLLYGHADEKFYLRQISRVVGIGPGPLQREVKQLTDAGIINRSARGNQVYYQANPQCPVFNEIKSLVMKTVGVSDVLKATLAPLADRIMAAFIYGSIARGKERKGSDVDVLIVGQVSFAEVTSAMSGLQVTLGREINPTVYPPAEFRSKVHSGNHFLETVLRDEKLFLIGDENELERLVKKRVAGRAQKQSSRNH